jgi:hypothetical protein
MEQINLRELDLEAYNVCQDADSPSTKWEKWGNRIQAATQFVENKRPFDQITHYFPPIHAPEAYEGENHWWCQMINFYWHDEVLRLLKHKVESSVYNEKPGWAVTLSPCPNFVYVFKKALEKVGLSLDENHLMAVAEIQNMFIFSNEVLDKIENYSGDYQNTFGLGYALADFLPDMKAISLPQALKQLFGGIAYEQDNRLKIISANEIINQAPEDWSKYLVSEYSKATEELKNYVVEWQLEDDAYTVLFSEQFEPFKIEAGATETVTIPISVARPLATRSNPRGTVWGAALLDNVYRVADVSGSDSHDYENPPSLGHNAAVRSTESEQSPENVIQQLLLGVYRGYDFVVPPYSSYINQSVVGGVRYGENSLLLNDADGLGENWLKDLLNFVNGGSPMEVALELPVHKVSELARFSKVKKSFTYEKGRVEGILKEFSFTASNKGISPVKATFIINNKN